MELDLTQILLGLLGTTSFGGIYAAVQYRKQNKKLKENEVKKDDVETQREQINLADEYMKKVMELSERNYEQAKKNGIDNENILKKIDAVATEQTRLADEQRSIVSYLNGGYQAYLQHSTTKPVIRKAAKKKE